MNACRLLFVAVLLAVGALSGHARAHKPSDSYLVLAPKAGGAGGRWDMALRDLNDALGVDADGDGQLTWSELQQSAARIRSYAGKSLSARVAGRPCQMGFGRLAVVRHSDGTYAALDVDVACAADAGALSLRYDLLFDLDAQHRGILRWGDAPAPIVLTKSSRAVELPLTGNGWQALAALMAMVRLGTAHILHGYDHLLFLIALLLPCTLRRSGGRWERVPNLATAARDVLRVVTAFTLAHSLTLGLAAAHWVALPSRFVESGIALSVLLAALNNLYPVIGSERWLAAFALGLLHGFGFAATLSDVGLTAGSFLRSLLGFNLGVELGQLGVVALLLPIIYGLSRSRRYERLLLPLGSAVVVLVASAWLAERALDLRIIS